MKRSVRVRDLYVGDVIMRGRDGRDSLGAADMCIVSYVGPVARSTTGWHAIVHSMSGHTHTVWADDNEGYVCASDVSVVLVSRVPTYQHDGVRGG